MQPHRSNPDNKFTFRYVYAEKSYLNYIKGNFSRSGCEGRWVHRFALELPGSIHTKAIRIVDACWRLALNQLESPDHWIGADMDCSVSKFKRNDACQKRKNELLLYVRFVRQFLVSQNTNLSPSEYH